MITVSQKNSVRDADAFVLDKRNETVLVKALLRTIADDENTEYFSAFHVTAAARNSSVRLENTLEGLGQRASAFESEARGVTLTVASAGKIVSDNFGILATGGLKVVNDGAISGSGYAVYTFGGLDLTNNGDITAGFYGVFTGDEADIVRNNRVIDARDGAAIDLGGGADQVVNQGLLRGRVDMGDGADTLTLINRGLIVGDVLMGLGNDTFDGRRGQAVDGLVSGGGGNDKLFGSVEDDDLAGDDGADRLLGYAGADRLDGGADDDTLDGGAGADTLIGGDGIDAASYASASAGVTVSLRNPGLATGDAAGDTFSGVENLIGSSFADTLYGDADANVLSGGAGADRLYGGVGDKLVGGLGDDVFEVLSSGAQVFEAAGQGRDTVLASVNFTLTAGQEIEALRGNVRGNGLALFGNELDNQIFGTGGADVLLGFDGSDRLSGDSGIDVLDGGLGNDLMFGGAELDKFMFTTALSSTNVDRIGDFASGEDLIRIDDAVFTALAGQRMTEEKFAANTTGQAQDSSDRIIYETDTGALFYDADGVGGAAGVRFAILLGAPTISFADIQVI